MQPSRFSSELMPITIQQRPTVSATSTPGCPISETWGLWCMVRSNSGSSVLKCSNTKLGSTTPLTRNSSNASERRSDFGRYVHSSILTPPEFEANRMQPIHRAQPAPCIEWYCPSRYDTNARFDLQSTVRSEHLSFPYCNVCCRCCFSYHL
jgi:hypothetical protein